MAAPAASVAVEPSSSLSQALLEGDNDADDDNRKRGDQDSHSNNVNNSIKSSINKNIINNTTSMNNHSDSGLSSVSVHDEHENKQRNQNNHQQHDNNSNACNNNSVAVVAVSVPQIVPSGVTVLPSGLQYRVLDTGEGRVRPGPTTRCLVHYEGRLENGKVFDSSYKRGRPSSFAPHQVIPGWTEALQLMTKGDRWRLWIPSELAYGAEGAGPLIGPHTPLVFDLDLIDFEGAPAWDKPRYPGRDSSSSSSGCAGYVCGCVLQ